MPRYFFNIFNDEVTTDNEGVELADPEAARDRGLREARILAGESVVQHGHLVLNHRIEIDDQAGAQVAVIYFRDAVEVRDTDAG